MKRKLSLLLISLLSLCGCEFMNTNLNGNSTGDHFDRIDMSKEEGMNILKTYLYDNLDNSQNPSYTIKTDGIYEDISGFSIFTRHENDAYIYQSSVSSEEEGVLFEGSYETYTYYNKTEDCYQTKKYSYFYNGDFEEEKRNPLVINNDLDFPNNLNIATYLLIEGFLFLDFSHPKDFVFPSSDLEFSSFEAYKGNSTTYSINFTRDLDVGNDHYFSDVKISIVYGEEYHISFILDLHINKRVHISFNSYIIEAEEFPLVGYTLKNS